MATENPKPKYQPWNEEEFNSDVYVRGMSAVQKWMYRTLLQASFFHSTRPYLPNDDEILWVLAGCESQEQWEQNKGKVLKRFEPVEDHPELLQNKRVVADWDNLQDIRERMSGLGKKSAEKRNLNEDSTDVERTPNARLLVANGGATSKVKEREVKGSEEKTSEASDVTVVGAQEQKKGGSDWHALSHRHKKHLGKPIADPRRHKDKYAEMCNTYGEDVVLECFDVWAESNSAWIRSNDKVGAAVHMFWKALPDLGADALAIKQAESLEAEQREREKTTAQKEQVIVEQNVQRQKDEHTARWTAEAPRQNEGDVLEYLAELEQQERN